MIIKKLSLYPYSLPLTKDKFRQGALIKITDELNQNGWGDIVPLPTFSHESLDEALRSLTEKQNDIIKIDWTAENCFKELKALKLLPSASFGLESAILSIAAPLPEFKIEASALLMGSRDEILTLAKLRAEDGFRTAKLKVSNLKFDEALSVINELKNKFRLRIDVNRAWTTKDSLHFFSNFSLDAFDYVEEPFQNPEDLKLFSHPLAIDESYPNDLNLKQLDQLPTLKAIVYKPTIQGGMANCLSLYHWAKKRGLDFVLSSAFESDIGLRGVATLAKRLSLSTPIGIGTFHYLNDHLSNIPLHFQSSSLVVPNSLTPKIELLHTSCLKEVY